MKRLGASEPCWSDSLAVGQVVGGAEELAVTRVTVVERNHGRGDRRVLRVDVAGQSAGDELVLARRAGHAIAVVGEEEIEVTALCDRLLTRAATARLDPDALAAAATLEDEGNGTAVDLADLRDGPVGSAERRVRDGAGAERARADRNRGGAGDRSTDQADEFTTIDGHGNPQAETSETPTYCLSVVASIGKGGPAGPWASSPRCGAGQGAHLPARWPCGCIRRHAPSVVCDGVTLAHDLPTLPPAADRRPTLGLRRLELRAAVLLAERPADLTRAARTIHSRGGHGLAIAASTTGDAATLTRLAGALRRVGLTLAVEVPLSTPDSVFDALLRTDAPLVLAVTPGPADAVTHHGSAFSSFRERLAAARLPWIRWAATGWPGCSEPGEAALGDVRLRLDVQRRDFVPACSGCRLQSLCPGPLGGWPALPPPATVSNQVDFVADAEHADPTALAVDPNEVTRSLLLRTEAATWRRYRCHDSNWSEQELALAVHRRGQVWLDRSEKVRLDDFAADLAGLRMVVAAEGNDDGALVPARWEISGAIPFEAEEAAMLARMRALRGVVVDVGAGPLRYLAELGAALAAGDVRYVAVEPDPASLAALRRTLPGARLCRGVGEALPLPDGTVDHVMVLRAWNHLREPERLLREAARVLRPGGSLLLVDNVAFALLRSREAAERAHAVPVSETPFEHYRNDGADEALAALATTPELVVEEAIAVGPGSGNQWLVRARRSG